MKTIYRKFVWLALITVFCGACTKDTLELYKEHPDVYFTDRDINDRTIWSGDAKFNVIPANDSIFSIKITAMGALADFDREVAVEVRPITTAIEGIHYEFISASIPAGKAEGIVKYRVKRAAEPHEGEVILGLKIIPNEHFDTDYKTRIWSASDKGERSVLEYHIFISNTMVMPDIWATDYMYGFVGYYSKAKYQLMIDLTGLPAGYWEGVSPVDGKMMTTADIPPAAMRLKTYLYEYTLSHGGFGYPDPDGPGGLMWVPGLDEMFEDN